MDFVVSLHYHSFLFLALCYLFLKLIFSQFDICVELFDLFIFTSSIVLILLPLSLFLLELSSHLFDLIFKLAHSIIIWLRYTCSISIEGITEVLADLTCHRLVLCSLVILLGSERIRRQVLRRFSRRGGLLLLLSCGWTGLNRCFTIQFAGG